MGSWKVFEGRDVRRSWFVMRGKRQWIWRDVKGKIRKWGWKLPIERWAKATIWYEGKVHGSYHIDAIVVIKVGEDETEGSAEAKAKEKCKQNVMDALKWQNWGEIEDNIGVTCESVTEDDGQEEEKTEVWRV